MDWVQSFEKKPISVIITSRPAAIAGLQKKFAEIGFTARKVLPLVAKERAALVEKFARRTSLDEKGPERSTALAAEIERSEYASLAQVPVTLNLLLHVLAASPGGEVLGRAELYTRAIGMMVQAERFRGRLLGDEAPEWTLDTVRSVAFWNQLQGCRAQRWACFDLGRPLVALRQQVERGRLPLLEDKAGQVQFAHLSYQESPGHV